MNLEFQQRLQQLPDLARSGIRWTPQSHLHLTLHFIASVSVPQTEALVQCMSKVVSQMALTTPLKLSVLNLPVAFPSWNKPRVVRVLARFSSASNDQSFTDALPRWRACCHRFSTQLTLSVAGSDRKRLKEMADKLRLQSDLALNLRPLELRFPTPQQGSSQQFRPHVTIGTHLAPRSLGVAEITCSA